MSANISGVSSCYDDLIESFECLIDMDGQDVDAKPAQKISKDIQRDIEKLAKMSEEVVSESFEKLESRITDVYKKSRSNGGKLKTGFIRVLESITTRLAQVEGTSAETLKGKCDAYLKAAAKAAAQPAASAAGTATLLTSSSATAAAPALQKEIAAEVNSATSKSEMDNCVASTQTNQPAAAAVATQPAVMQISTNVIQPNVAVAVPQKAEAISPLELIDDMFMAPFNLQDLGGLLDTLGRNLALVIINASGKELLLISTKLDKYFKKDKLSTHLNFVTYYLNKGLTGNKNQKPKLTLEAVEFLNNILTPMRKAIEAAEKNDSEQKSKEATPTPKVTITTEAAKSPAPTSSAAQNDVANTASQPIVLSSESNSQKSLAAATIVPPSTPPSQAVPKQSSSKAPLEGMPSAQKTANSTAVSAIAKRGSVGDRWTTNVAAPKTNTKTNDTGKAIGRVSISFSKAPAATSDKMIVATAAALPKTPQKTIKPLNITGMANLHKFAMASMGQIAMKNSGQTITAELIATTNQKLNAQLDANFSQALDSATQSAQQAFDKDKNDKAAEDGKIAASVMGSQVVSQQTPLLKKEALVQTAKILLLSKTHDDRERAALMKEVASKISTERFQKEKEFIEEICFYVSASKISSALSIEYLKLLENALQEDCVAYRKGLSTTDQLSLDEELRKIKLEQVNIYSVDASTINALQIKLQSEFPLLKNMPKIKAAQLDNNLDYATKKMIAQTLSFHTAYQSNAINYKSYLSEQTIQRLNAEYTKLVKDHRIQSIKCSIYHCSIPGVLVDSKSDVRVLMNKAPIAIAAASTAIAATPAASTAIAVAGSVSAASTK